MNTQFKKGHKTWNKGMPNTWYNPKGLALGHGWNRKPKLDKVCPQCKIEFQVAAHMTRIVCCSKSCATKLRKPHLGFKASPETKEKQRQAKLGIRGEAHWNYRDGGKGSKERHYLMGQDEYIQWREFSFIRDNYICQICGSKKSLQVDHKSPWQLSEERRYDLSNGITMCTDCHLIKTFIIDRKFMKWGRP